MQIGTDVAFSMGPNDILLSGSFQTNGGTAGAVPAANILAPRGISSLTVSQSGSVAGQYTVTLPYGSTFPKLPWTVIASPQAVLTTNLATDYFETLVVGDVTQSAGILSFVIQCHQSGTAKAPAATAGNRVNFLIMAGNNSGA